MDIILSLIAAFVWGMRAGIELQLWKIGIKPKFFRKSKELKEFNLIFENIKQDRKNNETTLSS